MQKIYKIKSHPFFKYLILLLILGFVLYANSFFNQMFWDDYDNILNNRFVKDWHYIPKYFTENLVAGAGFLSNYWRPVLLSVFSLEWHFFGDWVFGYHFINTFVHIVNSLLLLFILFYIFKNRYLAFFTSLLFLVHPLQTEAVTYVSGFGDSLSVFFIFLGTIFYIKSRSVLLDNGFLKNRKYILSILMYIFALMTKETAIIMPGLLIISDFFILNNDNLSIKKRIIKVIKRVYPFFIVGGVYILLRATSLNFINTFNLYDEENIFTSNFHIRLFTFFKVLVVYFKLLFLPFGLHMERTVELGVSFFSPFVIIGCLIFLFLLFFAFAYINKYPIISFGIFWFFISLFPTSNLAVLINGLIYEHWLYIPMIGIFLSIVWIGILLSNKFNLNRMFLSVFVLFLFFFSILTINRNREWRDPITFYSKTLLYAPYSYRVINNLGMAYDDKKDYIRAIATYKQALEIDPKNPVAYHNLGNTYRSLGMTKLAILNYNKAINFDPKFTFSYNNLASIYIKDKNYKKAREVFEKYLDYTSSKVDTLFLLYRISLQEGNFNSALNYLKRANRIDPYNHIIQEYIIRTKMMMSQKNEQKKD